MKKKELQELQIKEVPELVKLLVKKRGEAGRMLLEVKTGKVKNVHAARTLRRDIAQIATVARKKELEAK